MAVATQFIAEEGRPRVGVSGVGARLKARHDTKANLTQNRWHSTMSWWHRMIHEFSGAGTRTQRKLLLLAFQHIKEHLFSMSYEGDVVDFVEGKGACAPLNFSHALFN